MAEENLTAAKVVLLAVSSAIRADVVSLSNLATTYRKILKTDLLLRILLTYLPETLDSSEYVSLITEIDSGRGSSVPKVKVDASAVEDLSETDAVKNVRKLHLLPLAWPAAPSDAPSDPITLFLIHRAYRIDQQAGLITQLPELIVPFLERSDYLRTWMLSSLLPLLRLNYEYHPLEGTSQTIEAFEKLEERSAVRLLLSRSTSNSEDGAMSNKTVGRDIKGLIGPWMYGDTMRKRRKLRDEYDQDAQVIEPLDQETKPRELTFEGWEEVFEWISSQAATSWTTCVDAIEHWDGPGDVDLGGYADGPMLLQEHEQQHLERRYARAAIASAYLISDTTQDALAGAQRILARMTALLDLERMPNLSASAALLSPVPQHDTATIQAPQNAAFLRTNLLEEQNVLTTPKEASIRFLHALLISAFILTRYNVPCSIRHAGELALLQDESEQIADMQRLVYAMEKGPKGDDKYWIRARNELLWLHDWGSAELGEGSNVPHGRGVFGKVPKELLEMEMLKAFLNNTRYTLAQSTYEASTEQVLSKEQVRKTVIATAMQAYDNASNANRTRGGVKQCDDIIGAFQNTVKGSPEADKANHLVTLTHQLGQYRLVLKAGEPFKPVDIRHSRDPISIIGKVLEQNPRSYTQINQLLSIGEKIVLAGLAHQEPSEMTPEEVTYEIGVAKKRITSMCIDAALTEDDFETAYSYVMNRLSTVASEAQKRAGPLLQRADSAAFATPPPKVLDDWSWRAALQAGAYQMNSRTIQPTHLGNASGNLEIRHLEQRMDCLSQALRIAPPPTLQKILNVFRRCEEELDHKIKQEAEQEAAWDDQGDETHMPGGFGAEPMPATLARNTTSAISRTGDEAPMSLFDLTRVSAAKAQRSFSALAGGQKPQNSGHNSQPSMTSSATWSMKSTESGRSSDEYGRDSGTLSGDRVRKRDQLRNAAVGTLASGIGWLINAPAPAVAPGSEVESD